MKTPPCLDLVVRTEWGESQFSAGSVGFPRNPSETLELFRTGLPVGGRWGVGPEEQEDPRPLQHCSCELSWK